MPECHQLTFGAEPVEGFLLEGGGVAVDVIDHLGVEDHEPAVDPVGLGFGLLAEVGDGVAVEVQYAEPSGGVDGGDGGEPAVALVELDQFLDINVGYAVAVGQEEGLVAYVLSYAFYPSAGHGLETGVDDGDLPLLGGGVVDYGFFVVGEVEGDVAAVEEVVGEVLLDHVLFVPGADDEFGNALLVEYLHHVPEYGVVADLDHRFGLEVTLFGDAGSEAAGEDDCLHCLG